MYLGFFRPVLEFFCGCQILSVVTKSWLLDLARKGWKGRFSKGMNIQLKNTKGTAGLIFRWPCGGGGGGGGLQLEGTWTNLTLQVFLRTLSTLAMHFNYRLIARSGSPESWDQRSRWTWLTWIPAETCSYQSTSRVVWWECRVTAISGSSFKDPSKVCDLLITCVLSYETRFVLHWNIESPNRFSMQMSIPYRRITLILKDGWVDWKKR